MRKIIIGLPAAVLLALWLLRPGSPTSASPLLAVTETPTSAPPTATATVPATATPAATATSVPGATPTAAVTVVPVQSDPLITKRVDLAQAVVGDRVQYTIVVLNPNSVAVPNVVVTDTLSPLLDYLQAATTAGTLTYDPASRTLTVDIGSLAPGQEVTITVRARVNELGQPPDLIANTAFVSGVSGPQSSSVVTTQLIPDALPQAGEGPGPREWAGLIGFGALALLAGWAVVGRLRRA